MSEPSTKKSITELQEAAKAGDLAAQNALAMLNELGLIPEASAKVAMAWYAKAAKTDPLSALFLAKQLEVGVEGIPPDKVAAAKFFQLAEQGGFRTAEKRLAEAGIQSQRTVLLLDLTLSSRKITSKLLQNAGFVVIEATDAEQVIKLLQAGAKVDLVLSDVEMPKMNGIDMLAVIRQRLRLQHLPVIMVTALREVDTLKKAKVLGVQGWVLKPFADEALVQIIKKALAA